MKQHKLFSQLFKYFLFIIIPLLVVIALYTTNLFRDFYYSRTAEELERFARTMVVPAREFILSYRFDDMDRTDFCKSYSENGNFRVTIILPPGKVICDTAQNPGNMENHGNRPEMIEAIKGNVGQNIRFSNTLQETLMYVAIPVKKESEIIGVVRVAVSLALLNKTLGSLWIRIAFGGFLIILLAGGIALLMSKKISQPLEKLKRGAEKYSKGVLNHKLEPSPIVEINGVSESMNRMARELRKRIHTILRQQSREKVILAAMAEGIIALTPEKKILTINQAACRILKIEISGVKGKPLEEIIQLHPLMGLVQRALNSLEPIEEELLLYSENEQYLLTQGAPLLDREGIRFGTLIVLHDVTRLRALEKVRKEFAVNVSHELKTPLTSIKGFVGTLLGGAMEHKDRAGHFLSIIAKETDRIIAIVEDLLSLARIEREEESGDFDLKEHRIREHLINAIQACEEKARIKNIHLELQCAGHITGRINPHLFEQAVINLIDNGIKYSKPDKKVFISCKIPVNTIEIAVQDQGCGIPSEHIPRLFERFYRVDKARSREMDGTGLGLAIVKHIIHIHNGSVDVTSIVNEGSTFTIYLPVPGSVNT